MAHHEGCRGYEENDSISFRRLCKQGAGSSPAKSTSHKHLAPAVIRYGTSSSAREKCERTRIAPKSRRSVVSTRYTLRRSERAATVPSTNPRLSSLNLVVLKQSPFAQSLKIPQIECISHSH